MHIINAVTAIGREIGIDLQLNDNGVCTLNVGESGSLFLERKDDILAVSLAQKIAGDPLPCLERGLGLCHLKNDPRMGLRVALFRNDTVVCICKLEKHHISAGMADQVLSYLFDTMKKIAP